MDYTEKEQALAQACAEYMMANDTASRILGIHIDRVSSGCATASMTVTGAMLNGHLTCHGGYIFSLADTAFALACNSQNQAAVAASCTIDYILPALKGDVLTAHAKLSHQGGRTGIYLVQMCNQDNQTVALFKGNSTRIKRTVLPQ
ncbi:hydroxyphenylacetyl-CoA thioesterase PaaI [Shewanella psychropiezotolerans]|uniref:Hydroxyphenylacetyl-CoA thioesterase PaaI n=1 Tax=Shewanella psychropiezotolerans TaxID=2593655 RepID=A0ABX5WWZ5_9GAMM|nr:MULTISPECIES: hydroxyphenylacetyl-CoA thioesterase PaaI [Shewanella]MPY22355.1 hydroxyphenylacetyl-CoA thioesterase PaaI [Shewanella sp. YLB-07]QDO83311.1 hydroxyphenylacetyl-CoA thioesterase PaaI [Shewanella psychropiezotolerans]